MKNRDKRNSFFAKKTEKKKIEYISSTSVVKNVDIANNFHYADNKINYDRKYSFFDIADKIKDINTKDSKMPTLTRKHDNIYLRYIKHFFLDITSPIRKFILLIIRFIKEKGNHERSILIFYKDEKHAIRLPITNFLILFYILVIASLVYTGLDAFKKQETATAFYKSLSSEHKKAYNLLDAYDSALDDYLYSLNSYNQALKSLVQSVNYSEKEDLGKSQAKISDSTDNISNIINSIGIYQKDVLSYLNISSTVKSSIPLGYPIEQGGRTTSGFGPRRSPFGTASASYHNGIDIAGSYGSRVFSIADGTVSYAGWRGGYGWFVIVDHKNGYQTAYGHNSKLLVYSGQKVKAGQPVALMGNTGRATGVHVHFEVRVDGKPVNPKNYLDMRL